MCNSTMKFSCIKWLDSNVWDYQGTCDSTHDLSIKDSDSKTRDLGRDSSSAHSKCSKIIIEDLSCNSSQNSFFDRAKSRQRGLIYQYKNVGIYTHTFP